MSNEENAEQWKQWYLHEAWERDRAEARLAAYESDATDIDAIRLAIARLRTRLEELLGNANGKGEHV